MAKLKIERLSLNMTGWSESDASRLSHLITNRLAARLPEGQESVRLDNVRLNIKANENSTLDQLADNIVDGLLNQVRTTL